jgi:hypothetical protein
MNLKEDISKKFKHIVTDDFEIDIPVGWIDSVYIMMHEVVQAYKKQHSIKILRKPAMYQVSKIFTKHGVLRIKTNKPNATFYEVAEYHAQCATNHCTVCHRVVTQKTLNKTSGIFLCEDHIKNYLELNKNPGEK